MIRKDKSLHNLLIDEISITTRLRYNMNTNNIHIKNTFTKYRYKKRPINKSSTNYLGITCAEQVLSKVFKNVQLMTYCYKGYDFICSNGYLIDSKSSCKSEKYNKWNFHINKNKIPDYFIFLAFDNRADLNPEYIWLIPGNIVNDKTGVSISESKLDKWDEYKLDINKVIKCCDTLKDKK